MGFVQHFRMRYVSPLGVLLALVRTIRQHPANNSHVLRPLMTVVAATLLHSFTEQPIFARLGERSRILVEPSWLTPAAAASLFGNPPDFELTSIWTRVLRPGDLALDVGANRGVYSILAAELGAHVIALEPSTKSFTALKTNLTLNGFEGLVDARKVASGATAGTTLLTTGTDILNHVVTSMDDISPERLSQKMQSHVPTGVEEVEVVTLDSIVGERYVMAAKLDVEGQEEATLRGAEHLLRNRRIGYLQIETNQSAMVHFGRNGDVVLDMLRGFGYVIFRVDTSGQLHPELSNPTSHDVLAIDPDGPFWERFR